MRKLLKKIIFVDPWFDSNKFEFECMNVNELFDDQHNKTSTRV